MLTASQCYKKYGAHMRRKGLGLQDAIECVQNNKNRQKTVGKVNSYAYEFKKED